MRVWLAVAWLASAAVGCAGWPARSSTGLRAHTASQRPALRSTGLRAHVTHTLPDADAPRLATVRTELYVRCEDAHNCPNAVGLLVVEGDPGAPPERCTASLIAPDRALTASHCLLPEQRTEGAACPQVWLSFPHTLDAPAETVGCARVLSVVSDPSQDALHQEHAVVQLDRVLTRGFLEVDPTPPRAESIVIVASVTPHPVYGSTHALTTRLCRAIGADAAQNALGARAADVGWLESCPIARGNSGSPVIDSEGHLRAIVHGGTSLTSAYAVTSAPAQ